MTELKWEKEVEKALRSAAPSAVDTDRGDLRQDAHLAILQAGKTIKTSEQAYNLAVAAIKDVVRKLNKTVSLSDPNVAYEADLRTSSTDATLDILAVREVVADLEDADEHFVICALYGIGCESMTEAETARVLFKTPSWVHRKKEAALKSLRKKMNLSK